MAHVMCSSSTLRTPMPQSKNHNNKFIPIPNFSALQTLGYKLLSMFSGSSNSIINESAVAEAIDVSTDGLWCLNGTIYYSIGAIDAEYDPETFTWKPKNWNNRPPELYGQYIWSDGIDVYFSYASHLSTDPDYILNQATDTWERITTVKPDHFFSARIWTDGTQTYYSDEMSQKVWNRATRAWLDMTWGGDMPQYFQGYHVWKDERGDIYHSGYAHPNPNPDGSIQEGGKSSTWKLNKSNKSWIEVIQYTDAGEELLPYGDEIWYDGESLRCNYRTPYSYGYQWFKRTSDGLWTRVSAIKGALGLLQSESYPDIKNFRASSFWSDGENIFYSHTDGSGILLPEDASIYTKSDDGWHQAASINESAIYKKTSSGWMQLCKHGLDFDLITFNTPHISVDAENSKKILISISDEDRANAVCINLYDTSDKLIYTESHVYEGFGQWLTWRNPGNYQITLVAFDGSESEKSNIVTIS